MPPQNKSIDSIINQFNGKSGTSSIDNLISEDEHGKKRSLGKRTLRSYLREGAGKLSELPIFENKYYDLFKTPLDKFQEFFPEGGKWEWESKNIPFREANPDDMSIKADNQTLYELWRRSGAPELHKGSELSGLEGGGDPYWDKFLKWSKFAPREYGFTQLGHQPSKVEKILGHLFGVPQMIFGTHGGGTANPDKLVAEMAHGLMFEDPEKYGYTRKGLIEEMENRGVNPYSDPKSVESKTHGDIEPKLLEWLKSISNNQR